MAKTKVVSYSEIDTYRQCPLKHQLSYHERWRTDDEAEALGRGTLFHSVMEAHYGALKDAETAGKAPDAVTLYSAVSHLLRGRDGGQTDRQILVEWIYRGYVELYGTDTDWKIVSIERPLEVWLPTDTGGRSSFKLAGTADLVVRDMSAGGGLWIVDHKTCRNLPRQKDFDMEDQTALYTYLLRSKGIDIRGAIYNHCRTEKLKTREMTADERFKRTLTVRSDEELQTMMFEAYEQMLEAYKPTLRRDAPRTPDGERCGWKCDLTEACLVGRKSGPDRMRSYLEDVGFTQRETKPGPTFTKLAEGAKAL